MIIETLWKKEANGELRQSAEVARLLEAKYGLAI